MCCELFNFPEFVIYITEVTVSVTLGINICDSFGDRYCMQLHPFPLYVA